MHKVGPAALVIAVSMLLGQAADADRCTEREALSMARNWVARVVNGFGTWGGSPMARVAGIEPFERGERLLGYYCPVDPDGYLVVSLYKELAPVKAYSETGRLDPASEEQMEGLIKDALERMVRAVERRLGPIDAASSEQIAGILEIDYRLAWDQMSGDPREFESSLESLCPLANYEQGGILLSSAWHQNVPYNEQCPYKSCEPDPLNGRALVGCVATAASQIMRYWCWPPWGVSAMYDDEYDWINMPDSVTLDSPQVQIDAVAELCHETGEAALMIYTCDWSASTTELMTSAYELYFRYSNSANVSRRIDHSAEGWFEMIKAQINANRPVEYAIPEHEIVCDGWRESGSPVIREYHMNWGHGGSHTAWYVLDALYGGNPTLEKMIEDIVPKVALGRTLSGTYAKETFNYRYFDQDASNSDNTVFSAGQRFQFLPNVTATCSRGTIRFEGTPDAISRFFTRGDLVSGAVLYDGAINLKVGGAVVLR